MRSRSGISGNPVLIGAATILVIIVAVFLSYNANTGLPFVPTYQVNAEVPNAAQLVVGNDVKIGGSRVGAVSAIRPKTLDDGRTWIPLANGVNGSEVDSPRTSGRRRERAFPTRGLGRYSNNTGRCA